MNPQNQNWSISRAPTATPTRKFQFQFHQTFYFMYQKLVFLKVKTETLFSMGTAAPMTTMGLPLVELLRTVSKEFKLETPGAKTRLRNLFRYISVKWNPLPPLDMAVNTQENG